MNSEQRREKIISVLQMSDQPITATRLANEFSVTRQIIVADIALLRAGGHHIRAEHKGYVLEKSDSHAILKRVVVNHGNNDVKNELYVIVDNGGQILDVIIQHSVSNICTQACAIVPEAFTPKSRSAIVLEVEWQPPI